MDKENIISTTCEVCDVSLDDLKSIRKTRDISDARKIAAFILLDNGMCYSYADAAKEVGLTPNGAYRALMCFEDLLKLSKPFRFRYEKVKILIEKVGE